MHAYLIVKVNRGSKYIIKLFIDNQQPAEIEWLLMSIYKSKGPNLSAMQNKVHVIY